MEPLPRSHARRPYVCRTWNNVWRVYLPVRTNKLAMRVNDYRTWPEAIQAVGQYYGEAACSPTN